MSITTLVSPFPGGGSLPPYDTAGLLEGLRQTGLESEARARFIAGTPHTGFLGDLRLARKVVSVLSTESQVLEDPRVAEAVRDRLRSALHDFLNSGGALDRGALRVLITSLGTPEAEAFLEGCGRDFLLEVFSGEAFDALVAAWGQAPACRISFYQKRSQVGLPDRLLIRAMPAMDLTTYEGRLQAARELMERILGAFHEWEHWRHFNGPDPIRISRFDRRPRLVSETMSLLEEHRQRVRLLDFGITEAAWVLGQPIVLFLKTGAYEDYFGWRTGENLRRGILRLLGYEPL